MFCNSVLRGTGQKAQYLIRNWYVMALPHNILPEEMRCMVCGHVAAPAQRSISSCY